MKISNAKIMKIPYRSVCSVMLMVDLYCSVVSCSSIERASEKNGAGAGAGIAYIDVVSIGYDVESGVPIRPEWVGGDTLAVFAQIRARDDFDFIVNRIDSAVHLKFPFNCLDTRIACWIKMNDGSVDALTFCKAHMSYNGECYRMDTVLIRRVSRYLPVAQQNLVEEYIRDVMRKNPFQTIDGG